MLSDKIKSKWNLSGKGKTSNNGYCFLVDQLMKFTFTNMCMNYARNIRGLLKKDTYWLFSLCLSILKTDIFTIKVNNMLTSIVNIYWYFIKYIWMKVFTVILFNIVLVGLGIWSYQQCNSHRYTRSSM